MSVECEEDLLFLSFFDFDFDELDPLMSSEEDEELDEPIEEEPLD